jgi:hypothetical protein
VTDPTPTPDAPTPPTPAAPEAPAPPSPPATTATRPFNRDEIMGMVREAVRSELPPPPAPPKATPTDKDARATEQVRALATDPDAFLDREVEARTQKFFETKAAPGMITVLTNQRDQHVDVERSRIDGIAGPGYFDAEILPVLFGEDGKSGALGSEHPYKQANKLAVRAAVDGIFGYKTASDPDKLVDAVTKRKSAERAAQEAPTYWGPGATPPVDPNGRIPVHIRDAINRAAELGEDFTEADFKVANAGGGTLDGWIAAQKAAGKDKSKGAH